MKRNIIAIICLNAGMAILCTALTFEKELIISNGLAIIIMWFSCVYLGLMLLLERPRRQYRKPQPIDGGIEL